MAEEKQYPKVPDEITVYYQKAKDHRTVRADGAWAGLTPALEIQFAVYNDLQPMPKSVRHKVTERGLGPEVSREVDTGMYYLHSCILRIKSDAFLNVCHRKCYMS